ncbi:MAG TPA: hypothetical protein VMQ81_03495 [Acidimicrobiia bacterium]|nr:hypothetical protein [Acidimicrobiia bacterium]
MWTRTAEQAGTTRSQARPFLVAYGLGALAFLGLSGVQALSSTDIFQDPPVTTGEPFYLGLGSNVGILLWAATVVICLFTWFALGPGHVRAQSGRGLLAVAGLTVVLLADDLLILHERVFRYELRISEPQVMGIYAVIGVGCMLVAYRLIRQSPDRVLFVSVVVLFAVAVALDVIDESETTITGAGALEDAAEFLGVVGWLAFWSRTCARLLASTRIPIGSAVREATG